MLCLLFCKWQVYRVIIHLGVIEKLDLGSDGLERLLGGIVVVCKPPFVCGLVTIYTASVF